MGNKVAKGSGATAISKVAIYNGHYNVKYLPQPPVLGLMQLRITKPSLAQLHHKTSNTVTVWKTFLQFPFMDE